MSFHKSARNDVANPAGQSAEDAPAVRSLFDAVSIIEDNADETTSEQIRAAWQYIYESGAYRQLQGWYGRNVAAMLESGYIER